jgi:hypothetical protein
MTKARAFVALAAGFLMLAASQSPASAHSDKVFQGRDFATVAPDHTSGSVCDEERDGHRVYARWSSSQGEGPWGASANGADGSCGNAYFNGATAEVFQVCEQLRGTDACETEYT